MENSSARQTVDQYGWAGSDEPHTHGYLVQPIIEALSELQADSVVDIGCGNGSLCGMLSDSFRIVVGVEVDAAGCDIARRSYPQIPFYQLGVEDSPAEISAEQGLFDAVVSTEVVEHLYAPHRLPAFASELLKPNGALIITTPYHGYLKNLLLSLAGKWDSHHGPLWHGGHIKFWSKTTLTQLLEDAGYKVVKFKGLGRLPWLWKSMLLVAIKE